MDNQMAKRIYDLRKEKGLTLEQVASVVGVGKSTVRKWETGMIANMRRDKIAALATALGTTPMYLMGWTDDSSLFVEEQEESPLPEKSELETIIDSLSEEQVAQLIQYAKFLLSQG